MRDIYLYSILRPLILRLKVYIEGSKGAKESDIVKKECKSKTHC